MAAGTDCANGAVLSWGGTTQDGEVTGITYSESAAQVQVTPLAATQHVYCPGQTDIEINVDFVGITSIAMGDGSSTHALAITWNDSATTTDTITGVKCFSKEASGSNDSAITTSLTFKPIPT